MTVPAGTSATVKVPTNRPDAISAPASAVPSAPGTFFVPGGSYVFSAPA